MRGRTLHLRVVEHPMSSCILTGPGQTLMAFKPYLKLRWRGGEKQVVGSNPTRGKNCVTTLGKLFTPICLSHQEG